MRYQVRTDCAADPVDDISYLCRRTVNGPVRLTEPELDDVVASLGHVAELEKERVRKFPIQRTGYGQEPARTHAPIPWAVAERAYATYAGRYGKGQSLERLSQRGGFSCGEMDMYAPGWEAECTSTAALETRVAKLEQFERELESERDDALDRAADLQAKCERLEKACDGYASDIDHMTKTVIRPERDALKARVAALTRERDKARGLTRSGRVAELEDLLACAYGHAQHDDLIYAICEALGKTREEMDAL